MQIVNLTPHPISVATVDGEILATFQPSGVLARVATDRVAVPSVEAVGGRHFPVFKQVMGDVEGLPAQTDGVTYLVSLPCITALAGTRSDCVAPDTGPNGNAIRENGLVKAVVGFVQ